tara:strand:- start:272 stop:895 length:624 start_codon:yes stop_codon:yes gene_type:complete
MFDSEAVKFFKKRFDSSLGSHPWEKLQEQFLCHFLSSNSKLVLKSRGQFVDQMLDQMVVPELRLISRFTENCKPSKMLIIGDELGLIQHEIPDANFAFYSAEALQHAQQRSASGKCSLLLELVEQSGVYQKIFLLSLMPQLKEWKKVQQLGQIMKTVFESLDSKGALYLQDRAIYQDDFLIHLVSMDAEITSIEKYGPQDFLLQAIP